ncbi:tryptase-like [Photinus pyralis]|nr:tryptase-like [Photinus pyralis]
MLVPLVVSAVLVVQVGSQLPPGYVCVPAGTCPPTGNIGIDIRIVTPGGTNPCPPGQVPCLLTIPTPSPTPTASTCGKRSVTNVSPNDGFATQGAWPWQAYLVNQTGYAGSGVLINANTVLTAAHKVVGNRATPAMIGVYMGVYTPSQLGTRLSVSTVTIHPDFNINTFFNDIALLTLTTSIAPLPQQLINTACLPTSGQSFIGSSCTVTGWGQTTFVINDAPLLQQKQVNVTVVSYNACYTSMSVASLLGTNVNTYLDPFGEICAGGEAQRDACTQDGGSPLVCYVNNAYVVAGLVIWGKGCGQAGVYGVYVNVPYYLVWIQNSIANLAG